MPAASAPYGLADVWRLNQRVNLLLLDHLNDGQLALAPAPRARTIAEQFAHLHSVRAAWLEAQGRKDLPKVPKPVARAALRAALEESAEAVAGVLAPDARLKGFKRGPLAFCAYLLAHEGHHRGQILLHLKHAKIPVPQALAYEIWEWDKI
jgi:uncharacterized damage-inducible protein DinB